MGFGKLFTEGLASSGASSLTGVITGGLSQALGLSWSPQKAMEEQWKYNKKIMALQNQYQQQAAAQSQQYAKDYWDYTNAENQIEAIKVQNKNTNEDMKLSGLNKEEKLKINRFYKKVLEWF